MSNKYRKKPVVIEAIQWDGRNTFDVITFLEGKEPDIRHPRALEAWDDFCESARRKGLDIKTLEDGSDNRAKHVASIGDWIIKGVKGEFYPCKPDIFEATYERAE